MARRNTEPKHIPCNLEKEILDMIGDNKTNEKTFNDGVFIDGDTQLLGFYTYRGQVCILDDMGNDTFFSEYPDKIKSIIHQNIIGKNYE